MESDFIPRTISRIRIAVYGPPKVGKTTFVEALLRVEPAEKTGDYTYEALREYKRVTKMGISESVEKYRLTLIDVPGGQEHKEKRLSALNKIVGWIFMYDVTSPGSVEQLENMIKEELEPNRKLKSTLGIILVGTKADLGINVEAKKKAEELLKYIEKITKVPLLYGYKIPHVIISNKDPEAVQQVYLCIESIVFDLKPSTVVLDKLKVLEEKYKSGEIKPIPEKKPTIPETVKPTPPQQKLIPQKTLPKRPEKPVIEISKKESKTGREIPQSKEEIQSPEIPQVELPEIPTEMPLIEPLEDLDKLFTDTEETGLEGLEKITPEDKLSPAKEEAPEIPEIPEIPKPEIALKPTKPRKTKEITPTPSVEISKVELKPQKSPISPAETKPAPPITEAEKKMISEKIDRLVESAKKVEALSRPKETPLPPAVPEIKIKATSDKGAIELAMKLNDKFKDVTKIFLLAPQSKDMLSWSVAYDITRMVLGLDEEAFLRAILNAMMALAPINLRAFIIIGERKVVTGLHNENLLIFEGESSSLNEWLATVISANLEGGLNFEKKVPRESDINLTLASDREIWTIARRLKGVHPKVMNVYLVRKKDSLYEVAHDGARFLAKEQKDLISAIMAIKDEISKYLKDSIRFIVIRGSYSIIATFGIRGDSFLIFAIDGDIPLDLINFIFATAR